MRYLKKQSFSIKNHLAKPMPKQIKERKKKKISFGSHNGI